MVSAPDDLIATLAASLPALVPEDRLEVEWDRSLSDRLAGRSGRAVELRLAGPGLVLRLLARDPRRPVAELLHEVRGVVISRRTVPVAQWLQELSAQLHALAVESATEQAALGRAIAELGVREPGSDLAVSAADVPAGLRLLPARLAGRVPADVVGSVERICSLLLDTLDRLAGQQSLQAHTVLRAATDYLPSTLRNYVALPADWAATHDLGGGLTPLESLRGQLAGLESAVSGMRDAAVADDARALQANGTFLADKFGTSRLDQA